jgi:hypothetical protein
MENMSKDLIQIYEFIIEKHDKLERYLDKNHMSFHKSGEFKATKEIKDFIESKYKLEELN